MEDLSQKISNAELEIMQVVWEKGEPINYSEIRQAVGHNAKQTVQTLITRLVGKGILNQEKRDVYYYTPSISKEQYTYAKTKELMSRVYLGSAKDLVTALYKENAFSPKDIEELRQFWQEVKGDE